MVRRTMSGALLLLSLQACDTNPAEGKSMATVSEPATAAPAPPSAAGEKYEFSNVGSKIEFVGAKVTRKHDGAFGSFKGTIQLVEGKPERSAVTVEIDTASVSTDEEKLTKHLKDPDFFDVQRFPKARFVSTAVTPAGAGGASHTIAGNLELHGVTKAISFPANVRVSGDEVQVDAEFAINRKDFDIVYRGMPDDLIKDEVLLKFAVRAKKAG